MSPWPTHVVRHDSASLAGTSNAAALSGGRLIVQAGDADGLSGAVSVVVGTSTTLDAPNLSIGGGRAIAAGQAAGDVVLQGGDASAGTSSTGGSIAITGGTGRAQGGDVYLSTSTSTVTNGGSSGSVSDGDHCTHGLVRHPWSLGQPFFAFIVRAFLWSPGVPYHVNVLGVHGWYPSAHRHRHYFQWKSASACGFCKRSLVGVCVHCGR